MRSAELQASGDFGSNGPGTAITILPDPGSREGTPDNGGVFWRWTEKFSTSVRVKRLGPRPVPRRRDNRPQGAYDCPSGEPGSLVGVKLLATSEEDGHPRNSTIGASKSSRGHVGQSVLRSGILLWVILSKGDDHVEH